MELVASNIRFELPAHRATAGWRIYPALFTDALDYLEIRRLVAVRYSGAWQRVGTHYAKRKGYHQIVISQLEDIEQANNTLWHELAHALQAEQFEEMTGRPFHRFYREAYKDPDVQGEWGATYRNNAYEIHARGIATNKPFDIIIP